MIALLVQEKIQCLLNTKVPACLIVYTVYNLTIHRLKHKDKEFWWYWLVVPS